MKSFNRNAKEVEKLLTKHGFTLLRENKHYVWKHSQGFQLVTSKTPGDNKRFVSQVKSQVRKLFIINNLDVPEL